MITLIKSVVFFAVLFFANVSMSSAVLVKEPPSNPDPKGRYMFLMFGLQTEFMGPDSFNQMYQKKYETTALAKAFSALGYTVIVEMRPRNTVEEEYGGKIATQVKNLINQGVKPANIVVAGHSKGAVMALIAAGAVLQPEVKYVIMAGCALPSTTRIANVNPRQLYVGLVDKFAPTAQGKMLSIYDKEDNEFQTCREYAQASSRLSMIEKVVDTGSAKGKGHAAFYGPDPKWLNLVIDWLKDD